MDRTFLTSIPDVPSKTCTTALLPLASNTCPLRSVPSGKVRETISLKRGNLTCCRGLSVVDQGTTAIMVIHTHSRE